jgi:hypothetical protein
LDPNGGNVPSNHLFLLLSPCQNNEIPFGINLSAAADNDGIVDTIDLLINRSLVNRGEKADRLYFYYSGHGATFRKDTYDEHILLPKDFTIRHTQKSLTLRSILEYLAAYQFDEQFFFIDACRNTPPWSGQYRIGEFPRLAMRDTSKAPPQQFIYYATSPQVEAAETLLNDNEKKRVNYERTGAFTDALMSGLKGTGSAKAYDVATGEYIVRVDRLLDFVIKKVSSRILNDNIRQIVQIPRLGGERGAVSGSNPILAKFPVSNFRPESLNVLVEPSNVVSKAEVSVIRDSNIVKSKNNITSLPVKFELQPKEYSLWASAPQYESKIRIPVELYEPTEKTISLTKINGGNKE